MFTITQTTWQHKVQQGNPCNAIMPAGVAFRNIKRDPNGQALIGGGSSN